ncbi:MAG: Hint domain-containing protein, partial [Thermoactinomyces sp.]
MLAVDVVVLVGAVLDPVPGDELLAGAKLAADVGKVAAKKSVKSKINNAITNCFTAGTRIQTAEGEKNIEDIQVGDKVLAKDEKTGKQEYKEVVHLFQKQVDTIYQVHVGKEVIETTAEHPFWVAEKGWVQAKDLQPGD